MLRVFVQVTIIQQTQVEPNSVGAKVRNKTYIFDFVKEVSCTDSWRDFTNEGTVVLPKNLYVKDENGKLKSLFGTNVNIGGFTDPPILMRGDRVIVDYGYRFFLKGKEIKEGTFDEKSNSHLFDGWVSQVTSKKPIEFKFEDNFWKLKQTPCPTHTFKSTDSLEDIVNFLLSIYNKGKATAERFTFKPLTKITFGEFRVGNETIAEVLGRLRKTYHFESYFKGNELRSGIMVYVESEAKTHTFTFQKDIISNELEYKRKDDLVLSIVAHNNIEEETGVTTKDGTPKTKRIRLEVLCTLRNGSDTPDYFIKKKGEDYPPNTGGERMTLPYPGAKSIEELKALALPELKKYYFSGFKGKFTTFGIPFVKTGDNVNLVDPILPERNGKYKVKGVEYNCGMNGIRQIVQLDYKL
jgi:hypothetical protein